MYILRELSIKNILYYKFEWQTENFISFLVIFIIRNFYPPKNESQIIFSRVYDSKTVLTVANSFYTISSILGPMMVSTQANIYIYSKPQGGSKRKLATR